MMNFDDLLYNENVPSHSELDKRLESFCFSLALWAGLFGTCILSFFSMNPQFHIKKITELTLPANSLRPAIWLNALKKPQADQIEKPTPGSPNHKYLSKNSSFTFCFLALYCNSFPLVSYRMHRRVAHMQVRNPHQISHNA